MVKNVSYYALFINDVIREEVKREMAEAGGSKGRRFLIIFWICNFSCSPEYRSRYSAISSLRLI